MARKIARKVSLSDAVARDLPLPDKGDELYWDSKTPSFALRVHAGGTKAWVVYKRLNRTLCKVTIGYFIKPNDLSRRVGYVEARKGALAAIAVINEGRDPNLERRQQAREIERARADEQFTMQRCLESYLDICENGPQPKKPRTIKGYRAALERLKKSPLASVPIMSLTAEHLQAHYAWLCRRASKTKTSTQRGTTQASGDLRSLRAAYYRAAGKLKLDTPNPFKTLNEELPDWFVTPVRRGTVAFAAGQLTAWWRAVESLREGLNDENLSKQKRRRLIVSSAICDFLLLSLLWGTRRTELLELRWEHINFEFGYLLHPGKPTEHTSGTKNGEDNLKPLTRYVRQLLERRRVENEEFAPGSPWVFPSGRKNAKGIVSHIAEPKGVVDRVKAKCGIDFSPHDLRRTLGTLFTELGSNNDTVRAALNHKPTDTASRNYILTRLEPFRATFQRYEDKVLLEAEVIKTIANEVTVPADDYAAFLAWKQQQADA